MVCSFCNENKKNYTRISKDLVECDDCQKINLKNKWNDHFDRLDKLSFEKRLRLIEIWIYNNSNKGN